MRDGEIPSRELNEETGPGAPFLVKSSPTPSERPPFRQLVLLGITVEIHQEQDHVPGREKNVRTPSSLDLLIDIGDSLAGFQKDFKTCEQGRFP